MGYALAFGDCYSCKRIFSFNPHKVPSIRIEGERRPVCKYCMNLANAKRVDMGLLPHPIHPEAYEPLDETEL